MTLPEPIDEMVDGRGGVRPQWRNVLAAFTEFGEGGLAERARRLGRAFEEEGGTSLRPGAANGGWRCDPLPLPLAAAEFELLAAGLEQRARLLQAILADLYGDQGLIGDGTLPPALVYPNPAFLRPRRERPVGPDAVGAPPLLHCYAADLVRGPDGAWRVLGDLVTDPGGIGHAHENRRLLARVMPAAFRPLAVRQLRPFFDLWQDALQRLAPLGSANPGVALLTPGSEEAEWFEHMLLARELGCALVEGGDLTIRAGRLYLKTLRGLQPIDVLLSRVAGVLTDPLDLAPSGGQGVPGLLDAVRHGTVRMVNDPGAGILETPALAPFLPALAERLLGESLRLAGHPTLWLGDRAAASRVLAEPEGWIVRPAFAGAPGETPADRVAAEEIAAAPWRFVAAPPVTPSVAPCVVERGLEPRPILLRLFLAFDGARWQVMPGGIARIVPDDPLGDPRPTRSGLAKDVWVFDEEHGTVVGPPALPHLPLAIRRTNGDLPGRVAENFFWLGRYLERLEGDARLVRIALARLGRDGGLPRDVAALEILTHSLVQAELAPLEAHVGFSPEPLIEALLASARTGGTLSDLVAEVTRLTDGVRDRLTADMYGAFVHTLREAVEDLARIENDPGWRSLEQLGHAMIDIIRFTATVSGLGAENMVQGGGRLFLDLGRRIERAQAVALTIANVLDYDAERDGTGVIDDRLRLILELCDSAITYRNRYLMVLQAAPVLDLVIADDGNPRGLAFQLVAIRALLQGVVGAPEGELTAAAVALMEQAEAVADQVVRLPGQAAAPASLADPLRRIAEGIGALSNDITRRYFALLPVRQFVGTNPPTVELRGAA
jgi:uncharacterized circularly permuted ATP-grasp superfamily protein/uncharacterized alpha-E superfamily protein